METFNVTKVSDRVFYPTYPIEPGFRRFFDLPLISIF